MPGFGSPGTVSISMTSNRSVSRILSRQRERMARHSASGQSCRTWHIAHTSPVVAMDRVTVRACSPVLLASSDAGSGPASR